MSLAAVIEYVSSATEITRWRETWHSPPLRVLHYRNRVPSPSQLMAMTFRYSHGRWAVVSK